MSGPVRYELEESVAASTLDDGKANAISHAVIESLHECLERAEREARAVLIAGRAGRLSAGFDLGVMGAGPAEARGLVEAGARLMLRIYRYPRPVIVACT